MLIRELKEILQDQAHIFQDTYLYSSQIHQLTITYGLEHTNHDIFLKFVFQNLNELFLRARNLHQQYLPFLSNYKDLLFQVIMFH